MKKLIVIIFALLIYNLTFNNYYCEAQWVWQSPLPQGNWLHGVDIINSNTILAVGDGAVFLKSTNAGNNWTINHYFVGLNSRVFYCIKFINSNTGWIGGDSSYVSKTTNCGINWYIQYTGTQFRINKFNFINEQTGYACGLSGLIIKTTNGGTNWIPENLNVGTSSSLMGISFVNSSTGYVSGSTYYSPYGGMILQKTTNAGDNWFSIAPIGLSINFLSDVNFINEQTGFVGGNVNNLEGRLIKTTNSGVNWQQITIPSCGEVSSVHFINENTGWINTVTGFYKTTDGGTNWILQYYQSGETCSWGFDCAAFLNQSTIYCVECGKIICSTDGGNNFSEISKSCRDTRYKIFFINENTGWTNNWPGITKTTNGGNNWFNISFYVPSFIDIYFKDANTGWYLGSDSLGKYFHKTTNGGLNWVGYSYPGHVFNFIYFNGSTGYIRGDSSTSSVTYTMLYKTTNAGDGWNLVYCSSDLGIELISFINSTTGYSTIGANQIRYLIKTTNSGTNWFTINSMPSNYTGAPGICFLDENLGYIARYDNNIQEPMINIYKTTNGGLNWIDLGITGLGLTAISKMQFFDASTGYAFGVKGASNSEAYFLTTTNGGLNWNVTMPGVYRGIYEASFINKNTGWACGEEGTIIKTTNFGSVFVKTISKEVLTAYCLFQNYPNPFNPVTKIRFSIPPFEGGQGGMTVLKVYDVLGKEIETLVNEKKSPGTYEVTFDGSGLASGIYFYTLSDGDFKETKKLVLLK